MPSVSTPSTTNLTDSKGLRPLDTAPLPMVPCHHALCFQSLNPFSTLLPPLYHSPTTLRPHSSNPGKTVMNHLNKIKIPDRTQIDPEAIIKDIVIEEKKKLKKRRPLDMRQCICGHTGQRHKNIERFEILKQRTKNIREIEDLACADCECIKFNPPVKQKCKCGHDIKYHIKRIVEFNGVMIEVHPCKFAKCEKLCKSFKPKFQVEITREEMREHQRSLGDNYFGPQIIEESKDERILRLLAESEKENLEDAKEEI